MLWLRCTLGNHGAVRWFPVSGDPETQARAVFQAARADFAPGFDNVKLSGTFVGCYSVVAWGVRSGRSFTRFGEVNERNAGKPGGTLTGTVGVQSGEKGLPAPIVKKVCSGFLGSADANGLRIGEDLVFYNVEAHKDAPFPVKLNVKKYATVYGYRTPEGDLVAETYPEVTGFSVDYPIPERYLSDSGNYPVNPLLGEPRPSPLAAAPYGVISGGAYAERTVPIIIGKLTPGGLPNPLFAPGVGDDPQVGYQQFFRSEFTISRNSLGFGNLGVQAQVPAIYAGLRVKLSIALSFSYWRPEGLPYQEGNTVEIDYRSCVSAPPSPPEPSNICVSSMEISGQCLILYTCNSDGTQTISSLCVGQGEESFLKLAIEKGAANQADSDGFFSIDIGEDLRVQYKDETGFDWDLIIP